MTSPTLSARRNARFRHGANRHSDETELSLVALKVPVQVDLRRLVPGTQFLASKAVAGPGKSLKTNGRNFLAAPFANTIGPLCHLFQRPFNVLQHSRAKVQ